MVILCGESIVAFPKLENASLILIQEKMWVFKGGGTIYIPKSRFSLKSKFSKVRIFKIDFSNFVPHIEKRQKTQKKNILALKKHRFLDPKKHKFSKKALNDVFLACFLLFLSQKLSQKALFQGKLVSGNRFPVLFFGFDIIQGCFGRLFDLILKIELFGSFRV